MKPIFCLAIPLLTAFLSPAGAQQYFFPDPAFSADGYVIPSYPGDDRGYDLVLQPDGKIVAAGVSGGSCLVARFLPNGSPDLSFGSGGTMTFQFGTGSNTLNAIALQPDGKIVVAGGFFYKVGVARLLPNGALDPTFGTGGKVTTGTGDNRTATDVAITSTGKIVACSQTQPDGSNDYMTAVFRFLPNGSLDQTFSNDGIAVINLLPDISTYFESANAVLIDKTSGKILVGGQLNDTIEPQNGFTLYRLLDNGSLDPAFGNAGIVRSLGNAIFDLAQQPDGKFVAAGYTGDNLFDNDIVLTRYLPDGTLDQAFSNDGIVVTDYGFTEAEGVALQPDGKIIVAGYLWSCFFLICDFEFIVGRYNSDGSIDNTFKPTGFFTDAIGGDEELHKVAVQPNGDIVAVGYYENTMDENDLVLLRLTDSLPPTANFYAQSSSGCWPLTVHFKDQSKGNPTAWQWSFPGGVPSASIDKDPVVVYHQPGTYSATLTVSNSLGNDTYTAAEIVKVNTSPVADFTASANGLEVAFVNSSSGATAVKWFFGDGTMSTLISPTHTYAGAGTYDVVLVASNACGPDTVVQEIEVDANPIFGIRYVNHAATGANNGNSWADAYVNLQDAIDNAPPGFQIWVAKGVYKPTKKIGGDTSNSYKSFFISKNIAVHGGFNGTETALSQRNYVNNKTILSGDIDNNDVDPESNGIVENVGQIKGGNAYHVLWIENVGNSMRLDGFTVTAGDADGSLLEEADRGGGIYIRADIAQTTASPTIANCNFAGNYADGISSGGAVHVTAKLGGNASPVFSNCVFLNNNGSSGGGVSCNSSGNTSFSNPVFFNCSFLNNSGSRGGAVNIDINPGNSTAGPSFTNCFFDENNGGFGGAVYNTGGNPVWINCSFSRNNGTFGGAVSNSSGNLAWTNCSFSKNDASWGGVIRNESSDSLTLTNCIIWGNTGSQENNIYNNNPAAVIRLDHSLLDENSCPPDFNCGPGMIYNQDPLFANAANGNLRLQAGSPAIDKGDNSVLPPGIAADLDGNTRIFNATGLPTATVDLGAYEFGAPVGTNEVGWVEQFSLFPNPSTGEFTLEIKGEPAGEIKFSLFSADGRQLRRETASFSGGEFSRTFDCSDLPDGLYLFRIRAGEKTTFAKILIQR